MSPTRSDSAGPVPDAPAFTYHRRSGWGGLLFALSLVILAEMAGVHLLISRWSAAAAWLLTLSTAYLLVWLIADWRDMRRWPHRLGEDGLQLRFGRRWKGLVPYGVIGDVAPAQASQARRTAGVIRLATAGAGRLVLLRLTRPIELAGPWGIRRTADRIVLAVDERDAFVTALRERARAEHTA